MTGASLHVRRQPPGSDGAVLCVTPESAGWEHVGFTLLPLGPNTTLDGGEEDRETCIVLVSGAAELIVDGVALGRFGGRSTPFDPDAPGAAYVPARARFALRTITACEIALCTAPGTGGRPARLIPPDAMTTEVRGHGATIRHVRNILPETEAADALLVVEVATPGGHWSSYPPHKHDTATPGRETALEEVYYHRVTPPSGFVVQRVYTDSRDIDETIAAGDGEAVLVPRGYHPVGVPAGYTSYYLNVMAGAERRWLFRNDPAHDWITNATS